MRCRQAQVCRPRLLRHPKKLVRCRSLDFRLGAQPEWSVSLVITFICASQLEQQYCLQHADSIYALRTGVPM